MKNFKQLLNVINGETADKVSDIIGIRNAKRVVFAFRSSRTSGSVVFTVQATLNREEDENWVESVIMVSNTPHSSAQEEARTLSATITQTGTYLYALDLEHFNYDAIKVKSDEQGTGTSYCDVLVEY